MSVGCAVDHSTLVQRGWVTCVAVVEVGLVRIVFVFEFGFESACELVLRRSVARMDLPIVRLAVARPCRVGRRTLLVFVGLFLTSGLPSQPRRVALSVRTGTVQCFSGRNGPTCSADFLPAGLLSRRPTGLLLASPPARPPPALRQQQHHLVRCPARRPRQVELARGRESNTGHVVGCRSRTKTSQAGNMVRHRGTFLTTLMA